MMGAYEEIRVKLTSSKIIKFKSAAKNNIGKTLWKT